MDWSAILAHKTFWIYYLRWFQAFGGDRVTACCAFFGVDEAELRQMILNGVYQVDAEGESPSFHVLRLPLRAVPMVLEIEFQNFGPNEQVRLVKGDECILLADVDVDDARAPFFWLRDLPRVAARLEGPLAKHYGALLLYKLAAVAPEDDLDDLLAIVRDALPKGLLTRKERDHVLAIERRTWHVQQGRSQSLGALHLLSLLRAK